MLAVSNNRNVTRGNTVHYLSLVVNVGDQTSMERRIKIGGTIDREKLQDVVSKRSPSGMQHDKYIQINDSNVY